MHALPLLFFSVLTQKGFAAMTFLLPLLIVLGMAGYSEERAKEIPIYDLVTSIVTRIQNADDPSSEF